MLMQQIVSGLALGSVYALVALGFIIIYKATDVLNFAQGDILEVQLSGLPQTNNQGVILWVVLILVVLGTGFGFVYLMRKRRLQPVSSEDSLDQKRQRLLIELAHLDDNFEAGKIPEKNYRRLRSVRKAQLVELMQRSKEESDRR